MQSLETFGYLIQILCDIGRSIDQNCEGLHMVYTSFKSILNNIIDLVNRFENKIISAFKWMGNKIKNFFTSIYRFII